MPEKKKHISVIQEDKQRTLTAEYGNSMMANSSKARKSMGSKHVNHSKRNKKSLSPSDRKRTKYQIEKLNAKGLLPSELFELNRIPWRTQESNSSLLAKELEQDRKKDEVIQDKAKAKKQETDSNISQQIEMISGFSI